MRKAPESQRAGLAGRDVEGGRRQCLGKQTRGFSRSKIQPPPPDQAGCSCTRHLRLAPPAVCALLSSGCGMGFAASAYTDCWE